MKQSFKFHHAILGGTFDHFHAGHKHFIDEALRSAEKVTIGLTTSAMLKDKFLASSIEDYETRKKALTAYLKTKNCQNRVAIIALNDIYGTSLKEKNIDAIFVTEASAHNADIINRERGKINFPKLGIITIRHIRGDDRKVISSGRIRAGLIDRDGKSYLRIFTNQKLLILPKSLRGELRIPLGETINNLAEYKTLTAKSNLIIAVGDMVTYYCISASFQPDICIIDLKVKRKVILDREILGRLSHPDITVRNDPGTINKDAVIAYRSAIEKALNVEEKPFDSAQGKQVIKVIGEEDLLALPAVLLAPLSSIVLYGMPDKGAVAALVTEEKKAEVVSLVRGFKRSII